MSSTFKHSLLRLVKPTARPLTPITTCSPCVTTMSSCVLPLSTSPRARRQLTTIAIFISRVSPYSAQKNRWTLIAWPPKQTSRHPAEFKALTVETGCLEILTRHRLRFQFKIRRTRADPALWLSWSRRQQCNRKKQLMYRYNKTTVCCPTSTRLTSLENIALSSKHSSPSKAKSPSFQSGSRSSCRIGKLRLSRVSPPTTIGSEPRTSRHYRSFLTKPLVTSIQTLRK